MPNNEGKDFRYQLVAAVAVFAAVILVTIGYHALRSPERDEPALTTVSEAAFSTPALHGWHSSVKSGERGSPNPERAGSLPDHPSQPSGRSAVLPGDRRAVADNLIARRHGSPAAGRTSPTRPPAGANVASARGAQTDEPTPSPDDGNLSISGRVLSREKEPLPGIEVTARRYSVQRNAGSIVGSALSAGDGSYEIVGLSEGEYDLRTTATDLYREGQLSARTGVTSADIVLDGYGHTIRIAGTVTDPDGRPLEGVRVLPPDLQYQTQTDSGGNYETALVIKGIQGTYSIVHFTAKGYREKLAYVDGSAAAGEEITRVDAQLEPVGETVVVPGVVTGNDGSAVIGARVQLQSAQLGSNYGAISGNGGKFSIANVKVGADYRLTVFPRKGYRDYEEAPVAVSDGAFLEIVLESLDTGRLTGRMVDADGRGIPRFSMWLSSSDARAQVIQVSGDDQGAFAVDQAPAGVLTFSTRSVPQFSVSGISVAAGETQDVTLVLDWGDQEVAGHVTDSRGRPVAGAPVALSWSAQAAGLISSSSRAGSTDTAGSFRFTQLGPGSHTLTVQAPNRPGVQDIRNLDERSRDVEVRLP